MTLCSWARHFTLIVVSVVSVLYCGSNGLISSPSQGHCVVFLGKTLYPHSRASDRVRKKITNYVEIFRNIMRKKVLIMRKTRWIMRKIHIPSCSQNRAAPKAERLLAGLF